VVAPEGLLLVAERSGAGVVGGLVIGYRRAQLDRKTGSLDPLGDLLTPVGVDLAGEVDAPGDVSVRPSLTACSLRPAPS